MNNLPSTSKTNQDDFEDDDIFDDSSLLANFDNTFKQASKFSESNINDSANKSALNVSALCCDEEISGYDKLTGKTWIYPTNYPVRDYQFNIIKAAILQNTLVSLPTGLGKTFIAAVIMYNFYRWYPLGKIVFIAPTKPLVAQQIEACYNIIAIPPDDTVEMTGNMQVNTRKQHWQSKRVFFATPQVIYNDMKSGICPCDKLRCLVIDEAHKARGNYAYCQIIHTLDDIGHKTYRVLALSATPGSKVEDVINVVKNLHIAHLELRTENCIDVAPYSHARKINTCVIQLGHQLTQLRQQYIEILDSYARRLKQMNILPTNLGNLSKGRVVMLYKEFQNKDRASRHPQHNYIMKDFTVLIALYHGLELLVQHGARVFLNFFDEHPEKTWIQSDDRLTALLERLRDDLGVNPLSLDRSMLPDGSIPEMPKNLCFGHPKFDKLKELMTYHFTKAKHNKLDTRAIVFCEYRESVNLVHCLLLQCQPLIKPQMFVGQGASGKDGKAVVSQRQQLRVMRDFREGKCNVLVATCVAEEGLDVGSVDLIICFDISTKSPIRLVQRCGRTGRERGGQVYILVTEGREHQTLMECMRQRDGLNKKILQSKEVENNLYKLNPRMMPHDFMPQCQKMFITVQKKPDPKDKSKETEKAKKGQKDLRAMLLQRASTSSAMPSTSSAIPSTSSKQDEVDQLITETEFNKLYPDGYKEMSLFAEPREYLAMNRETLVNLPEPRQSELNLAKWLEWQRRLQKTVNIHHSKDSEIFAELLQYSDAKRFDMPPSTQNPCFPSQEIPSLPSQNIVTLSQAKTNPSSPAKAKQPKNKQKATITKPERKDGDIRALFSTATKSTKNYTKLIKDLGIQNDGSISTRLISLLVDLSLDNNKTTKKCYFCQNICDCSILKNTSDSKESLSLPIISVENLKLPNINLINEFDADSISKCAKKTEENICDISKINFDLETDILSLDSPLECVDERQPTKQDSSVAFDRDKPVKGDISVEIDIDQTIKQGVSDHFDIGDIADIFADSSPEEGLLKGLDNDKVSQENTDDNKIIEQTTYDNKVIEETTDNEVVMEDDLEKPEAKETLGFFGLDSIDDIFADDEIDNTPPEPVQRNTKTNNTNIDSQISKTNASPPPVYPLSPSILTGRQKPKEVPTSPILCSQPRKFQLSTKKNRPCNSTPLCQKELLKETLNNNNLNEKPESSLLKSGVIDTSSKSMMSITQLVEMINKTDPNISAASKSNTCKKIEVGNDLETSPILLTQAERKERSVSPILLTQTERKKSVTKLNNSLKSLTSQYPKKESLIILDSDTDSNDTVIYDHKELTEHFSKIDNKLEINVSPNCTKNENKDEADISPCASKRKRDSNDSDIITESPYFNKKQKIDNQPAKQLTLQEKVLAAISSTKQKNESNDRTVLNCVVSQPNFPSHKENKNPQFLKDGNEDEDLIKKDNLSMLQMFRRDNKDSKLETIKNKFDSIFRKNPVKSPGVAQKRKITFEDSDDDFVSDKESSSIRSQPTLNGYKHKTTTNHKVRKKKKKGNEFLDMEAELSDADDHSGDELSDESVGSIVDFICDDDNVTHHEDIQAVYLKSIKSPVRGRFKIPELPKRYNKEEILSQYVEEDAYEMDSFCVDSHIGLTQVNDVSELELAEMILEGKRKGKKKARQILTQDKSPDIGKRKNKPKRRLIDSDSSDDN